MRNTGFLKLTKKPDCWLLQIQARNIPVTNQHLVPLCAILTEQEHNISQKISELPCNSHIISAQLTLPDSAINSISSMENLHGFLIPLPDESFLTATESHFHLDINEIFSTTVQSETPGPAPDLSASEYNDNDNLFEASDTTNLLSPSKTIQKIHHSDLKILPKNVGILQTTVFFCMDIIIIIIFSLSKKMVIISSECPEYMIFEKPGPQKFLVFRNLSTPTTIN